MFFQCYVYILECSDGLLYTGYTRDIDRRIKQHNAGINKTAFTYSRRPVRLLYHEMFHDVFQALHYEKRIKKWSAAKKLALAAGDEQLLKMLASCQNDSSSAFASTEYVPKRMRKR